jgi:serine/threonine protein kinase
MYESFCPSCLQSHSDFSICPNCGWSTSSAHNPDYLYPGTVIYPPYQIARVLGHGGFGITYLGWDANLQTKVAIKEYLPRDFAKRDNQGLVSERSKEDLPFYLSGLSRFLEEARLLAKFQQHPGIVSVLTFFRALGTGYMVMEYVEGRTLSHYLQQHGQLNWKQTHDIFMHIMDALRAVHAAGLLHRDIAPDNIYLCNDGRIKLLDFGAAENHLGQITKNLQSNTIIAKQGFTPAEQYQDSESQGPWSDVYGVAASMYYCLTALSPPNALDRLVNDTLKPPSALGVIMPFAAEQTLISALAATPLQRPQSIESLQVQLSAPPIQLSPKLTKTVRAEASGLSSIGSVPTKQNRIFHAGRWILLGLISLLLLILLFSRAQKQVAKKPTTLEPLEITLPATDEAIGNHALDEPLESDSLSAEELKRQQAAALRRFEENNQRQNPDQPGRAKPQTGHLQSLCAEWGATMDCKK